MNLRCLFYKNKKLFNSIEQFLDESEAVFTSGTDEDCDDDEYDAADSPYKGDHCLTYGKKKLIEIILLTFGKYAGCL